MFLYVDFFVYGWVFVGKRVCVRVRRKYAWVDVCMWVYKFRKPRARMLRKVCIGTSVRRKICV